MIYSDLDHATYIFVQKLLGSKILSDIEDHLGINITFTDITKYLSNAKEISNFLIRYPQPILTRLVYHKIISPQEIIKYKFIFDYFKISMYSPTESISKFIDAYSHSPEGYFKIFFKGINFDYGPLMDECKNVLNAREADYKNALFIPLESISEFIKLYKNREIEWSIFCMQKGLLWTNELLFRLNDVLDWERLHRNPSVPWNFELIDSNKDKVNWAFISSYPSLKWNIDLLDKYKEYLIFSLDEKSFNKGGKNKKGNKYYLIKDSDGLRGHFYSNLNGSISLSESIDWSEELISCFIDYWNWSELSSNKAVNWTEELIDTFSNRIDFNSLSFNISVSWTEKLLDKYLNKWKWENLSGNTALPWSYNLIKKYENKWKWKGFYSYSTSFRQESFGISISTNSGISWNEKMLSEWKDKIDFWTIARLAAIQGSAINLFYKEFDKENVVNERYRKDSDWGWEKEEFHRSGWENLALNKNFFMNLNDINSFYKLKIPLPKADVELTLNGNNESGIRLLERMKGCSVENVTLDALIENEPSWTQLLINKDYINNSIWSNLIKPLFTEEFCNGYLCTLGLYINNYSIK